MASDLGRSGGGLHNGKNLGNALDLVGVYMKNYKLDKADAVLSRCGPFVSQRGGVWMIKWLNHVPALEICFILAGASFADLGFNCAHEAEPAYGGFSAPVA
eukprot:Skav216136  [mRNA]  locus=scaffold1946:368911:369213:+ [translate_table: standard]